MKMLFYEFRKTFLRKYMFIVLCLMIILNVVYIIIQYEKCGTGFSEEITKKAVTSKQWDDYTDLHQEIDGNITKEKVQRITKLENGDTKSVKEYDEMIVHTYFYQPVKYMVSYQSLNNEIVDSAKENVSFYSKIKNSYEVNKNRYIIKHYKNRKLGYFFETQGWKKLFQYGFSDVFIMILLLLAILPGYGNEEKSGMKELILTTKKWKQSYLIQKKIAVFLFTDFLLIIFAVLNYFCFDLLYGLPGPAAKLYTLTEYQYSPLNISLVTFYIFITVLKSFSIGITMEIILVISRKITNVYVLYVISLLMVVIFMFCSGWICSDNPMRNMLSMLSPLTGIKANELYMQCRGINCNGFFVPWMVMYVLIQFAAAVFIQIIDRCLMITRRLR